MLFPQKNIGLIGKETEVTILSEKKIKIELVGCPQNLTPLNNQVQGQGRLVLRFYTSGLSYHYQMIKLRITDLQTEQKRLIEIMSRAFSEKEFFVCLVQSSNIHYGWNPVPTAQYFRQSDDELVLFKDENMGNDAFVHAQKLEPIFHKYSAPITWLVDDTVVSKAGAKIKKWHWKYGDDYGLLPRSYFYHNCCNYNTETSLDQTTEILTVLRDAVQDIFEEANYPNYTNILGVDQWVGSIGTNFIEAAQRLGLSGIWGMGYDHLSCDTSMYHRGSPWDIYRPKTGNFRIPGNSELPWLFQWTTRDILNTSYFSPNGATTFSTDADDIRSNRISLYQKDYYARLLGEYKKNMAQNDVFVFLVHQEDHDSHIWPSNRILENFLDQIHSDNLFATLEEIASWLNLKYQAEEHPRQLIEMNDPLTCHREMKQEAKLGNIQDQYANHPQWGDGENPKHVAYYGTDSMWITRRPKRTPLLYYNYLASDQHPFSETGEYPLESLPKVTVIQEFWNKEKKQPEFRLILESDGEFDNLPFIIWDAPLNISPGHFSLTEKTQGKTAGLQTATTLTIIIKKVTSGTNQFTFQFK